MESASTKNPSIAELSFIGNGAKATVQLNIAIFSKQSHSRRDGKPIPCGVMQYIQDGALNSIVLFVVLMYLSVLLCFQNLLCLRSQILKRVTFALFVRISAMQIIGSFQIVTDVTSVVPTFVSCIALLVFLLLLGFTAAVALSVRMRWGFRSCGSDLVGLLAPLKTPSPAGLSWTSLWVHFYFCAILPPRLLSLGSHFLGRV